jgi:hypothetical protein
MCASSFAELWTGECQAGRQAYAGTVEYVDHSGV